MAKFIKTYELHLGDVVDFRVSYRLPGQDNFKILRGTVQDISEFPEVWVETGDPNGDDYKRYHISVNLIEGLPFSDEPWIYETTEYEKNEPVEFVYNEDCSERVITNKTE